MAPKVTISGITGLTGITDRSASPPATTVPDELDYDMWLGPLHSNLQPERVHSKFRAYWDYDGGDLGDMGQHYLDPVQYF